MKGNIKEAGTARSDELSEQQRLEFSSVIKINFSKGRGNRHAEKKQAKKKKKTLAWLFRILKKPLWKPIKTMHNSL